jgi:hypothetical protein
LLSLIRRIARSLGQAFSIGAANPKSRLAMALFARLAQLAAGHIQPQEEGFAAAKDGDGVHGIDGPHA